LVFSRPARLSFLHLTAACGFALFLAAPAWANAPAAPATNALCREAYLKRLIVQGTGDALEGKDLCAQEPAGLPAKMQEAIRDAKEVHEKVAQTFGLSPEALFAEGVNLRVISGREGLNGTYKDESREVELGAVINPRRWIEPPVYAHELGHWVADSKNPLISSFFRESRYAVLLDETLPDTVSLATYGTTGNLDPDLPACMSPRLIDGKQTYNAPMDYFAARTGSRAIRACCDANKGRLSAAAEGVCSFVAEVVKKKPLPPLRPGLKFSVKAALADPSKIDTHQIGVPVNSFLYALGAKLGRPLYQEFLLAAHRAKSDTLSCRFASDGKRAERLDISVTPFVNQLEAFHEALKPAERPEFERLLRSFGLESAIAIDDDDLGQRANAIGTDALFYALRGNRSARLNDKHRCYGPLTKFMSTEGASPPPGCDVVCDPK
jgi:hypothetical protein